jgi:hypothetical protein
MRKRLAAAVALCLTCLLFQRNVMAQDALTKTREQVQRMQSAIRECQERVEEDPRVVRVRREIFPLSTDPNRYAVLASTEMLSEDQKRLLLETLPFLTKCREVRISGERGTPFAQVTASTWNQFDLIYGQLLRGETSIGRANGEAIRIQAEGNAARTKVWTELTAALAPRATSDAGNGNSSGSSSLLPFLMQQQLLRESNDAAAQRNRELIDAVTPRPTQTDCTRDGWGNVRCTTR